MELQITNVIGNCDQFLAAGRPVKEFRQIVISPLKVNFSERDFDSQYRVVNGCNMGENCMNPDCWFGYIIREKKRAEAKIRKGMSEKDE